MMQYLYRLEPSRPEMLGSGATMRESRILEDHFEYIAELVRQGVVHLSGRTQNIDDSSFGIVILSADSEDEARTIMSNDPAVRGGVMRARLFPYRVAIWGKPPEDPIE